MKAIELEVTGNAYPIYVCELGMAKLTKGDRILVDEAMHQRLEAHAQFLDPVGTREVESLAQGGWQRVQVEAPKPAATAKDTPAQDDLAEVARNMSMAGKPGRRNKGKPNHLG
jgi:hypothetical protein